MRKLILLIVSVAISGCATTQETCLSVDMTASLNVSILPTVGFTKLEPTFCFRGEEEQEDDRG